MLAAALLLPRVTIAAFVIHGISVTIGRFLGATLPARPMVFASAIAFLISAGWSWHDAADDETISPAPEPRFALPTVVSPLALALGAGIFPHRRLPQQVLHLSAGVLLAMFGLWMLFDSALGLRSVAIAVTVAVALAVLSAATAQTLPWRRIEASTAGRSLEAV
jgi:putative Ca2+/H+ antiporter (TMEM165/GDT1 family)